MSPENNRVCINIRAVFFTRSHTAIAKLVCTTTTYRYVSGDRAFNSTGSVAKLNTTQRVLRGGEDFRSDEPRSSHVTLHTSTNAVLLSPTHGVARSCSIVNDSLIAVTSHLLPCTVGGVRRRHKLILSHRTSYRSSDM